MSESTATLEILQSKSLGSRRPRPPDLDMAPGGENRVPLRVEEKLRRRESRLGLRSIFSRQKSTADLSASAAPSSVRELSPRNGGIRASLAEISNWPYGFRSARSEIFLPATATTPQHPIAEPSVTVVEADASAFADADPSAGAPAIATGPSAPAVRSSTMPAMTGKPKGLNSAPAPRSIRGALATWDPPPLFQAYPQAIRHVELPACTLSAETILRMHGGKGSISLRDGLKNGSPSLDQGESLSQDPAADRVRRKHRRNTSGSSLFKVDWTTKIYVLVTSGYLLQYAGEGSFDRLPEKILHLSKDSAAFASDLIPGRHWVVQVSAAMDADGTAATDNRSLLSRLPFRGPEKRQASLFLMVFESADEMDQWIAILRREIEHLGGKKSLSETGRPKTDEDFVALNTQTSQRTLVLRDPDRFSRISSAGPNELQLPWERPKLARSRPDIHLDASSDSTPDQSFDDVSTTNSMVSHDGRQLDSLRDNRFSFISSGQRTITTPEGSSPACSPVRDSFSSQFDEPPFQLQDSFLSPPPPPPPTSHPGSSFHALEAQPRPNAQAILDRRMSMRTMNPMVDVQVAPTAPPRPLSTLSDSHTTPNFSIPHAVSKRYSLVKSPSLPHEPVALGSSSATAPPNSSAATTPRTFTRRPPPPSLGFSRPLSIVADFPSPVSTSPLSSPMSSPLSSSTARSESKRQIHDGQRSPSWGMEAPDTPSMFDSWGQHALKPTRERTDASYTKAEVQVVVHTSPRRHASLQTLRPVGPDHADSERPHSPLYQHQQPEHTRQHAEARRFVFSNSSTLRFETFREQHPPRSKSSLGSYERERPLSPPSETTKPIRARRSSMFAKPTGGTLGFLSSAAGGINVRVSPLPPPAVHEAPNRPLPSLPMPKTKTKTKTAGSNHTARPSASTQHLRVASDPKALMSRRSMPQLTDGPPPAPPPTCALPPLPTARVSGPARAARSQSIWV